jgi:hypothetical protein
MLSAEVPASILRERQRSGSGERRRRREGGGVPRGRRARGSGGSLSPAFRLLMEEDLGGLYLRSGLACLRALSPWAARSPVKREILSFCCGALLITSILSTAVPDLGCTSHLTRSLPASVTTPPRRARAAMGGGHPVPGGTGGIRIIRSGGSRATGEKQGAPGLWQREARSPEEVGLGLGRDRDRGGAGRAGVCEVGRAVTDQQGRHPRVSGPRLPWLPSSSIDEGTDTNSAIATSWRPSTVAVRPDALGDRSVWTRAAAARHSEFSRSAGGEWNKGEGVFPSATPSKMAMSPGLIAPIKIRGCLLQRHQAESLMAALAPQIVQSRIAGLPQRRLRQSRLPACAGNPSPEQDTPGYLDTPILHGIHLHTVGMVPVRPHHVPACVSGRPDRHHGQPAARWNPSFWTSRATVSGPASGCADLANGALDPRASAMSRRMVATRRRSPSRQP